jgi:hypothetical protein
MLALKGVVDGVREDEERKTLHAIDPSLFNI